MVGLFCTNLFGQRMYHTMPCVPCILSTWKKYGEPMVVFDGYESGPTIKDAAHIRRKTKSSKTILFKPDMIFNGKKDEFLSSANNKQRFINLLSDHIKEEGMVALHASSDADTLIVETAVEVAKTQESCIVGDDTDLLIIALDKTMKAGEKIKSIYLNNEKKKTSNKQDRIWHIKKLVQVLGEKSNHILFTHAFLGCDTTSHPYGIGKQQSLKLLENKEFIDAAKFFGRGDSTKAEIEQATEQCFLLLYKAPSNVKTLNELRYIKFVEKVSGKLTAVLPQTLPPTSNAAKYHGWRVYFQVREWSGVHGLVPEEWGWTLRNGKLLPRTTDKAPAPENLLAIIQGNCKGKCDKGLSTCRKHGLPCSYACGTCKGRSCENREEIDFFTDDSDEET